MLAEQAYRLIGVVHTGFFADLCHCLIRNCLNSHEDIQKSCLLIHVQDIGVADNVLRANRGAESYGEIPLSDLFQNAAPNIFQRGGILVGKPEELNGMSVMQPGQFVNKLSLLKNALTKL